MILLALAVLAANPTNVISVLAGAKSGDTVRLVEGHYPVVWMRVRNFDPPLTVDASAATVAGVQLFTTVGVRWTGGTVKGDGNAKNPVTDYGINAAYGSRNISIIGVHITNFRVGIVFDHIVGGEISGNWLDKMRADGMDLAVSRSLRIANNACSDFVYTPGEHVDCIQAWSKPTDPPVSDIDVVGNSAVGVMQGISFFNNVGAGGFDRVTISGNTVLNTYGNGIALHDCRGCTVRNNNVNSLPTYTDRAQLYIVGGSVTQCGNVVPMVPRQGTPPCKD